MQPRIHPQASLHPFDWYREMRDNEPVAYDDVRQMWHVFRYADAARVLADHRTYSSDRSAVLQQKQHGSTQRYTSLIGIDPPRHRELRSLVAQAFTPRTIVQLEPNIRHITHDLLTTAMHQESFDVVRAIAYPLPMLVIAHLLGLPTQDHERWKGWADRLVSGNFNTIGQNFQQRHAITLEMAAYFQEVVRERRQYPGNDLISLLVRASDHDMRITDDELIAFCILLLVAGHETTTCLISSMIRGLIEHPESWQALRRQPTLAPGIIDEMLRLYTPLKVITRITTCPVVIGDQSIAAHQPVCAWIGSANRDERHFANPDQIDVQRSPSGHLSFGHGIHTCIAAALGRLEALIVLEAWAALIRSFSCVSAEQLQPLDSVMLYGVKQLPVTVSAAR